MNSNPLAQFERLARIMSWLDKARWSNSQSPIRNETFDTLEPDGQLLVHWLCYITDRQRPFEQAWDTGGRVFSRLVKTYLHATIDSAEDVMNQLLCRGDLVREPDKDATIDQFLAKDSTGKHVTYAPRYPVDMESIARALCILVDYGKSLTQFLAGQEDWWQQGDDTAGRLAFLLYWLTYSDVEKGRYPNFESNRRETFLQKVGEAKLPESVDELTQQYELWSKGRYGHKRLWAALRDYLKPGSYFHEKVFLKARLTKALRTAVESQETIRGVELPGDQRNNVFCKRVVHPLFSDKRYPVGARNVQLVTGNSSQSLRRIYNWVIERSGRIPSWYPEQFDVTFEFTPKMCDAAQINPDICTKVCPLGPSRGKRLCLVESGGEPADLCPVAFAACGYIVECEPEGCPVCEGVGQCVCPTGESSAHER